MDILSPRVRVGTGLIILFYSMVMTALDAILESVTVNQTIMVAFIGLGSTLISAGLLTKLKGKSVVN